MNELQVVPDNTSEKPNISCLVISKVTSKLQASGWTRILQYFELTTSFHFKSAKTSQSRHKVPGLSYFQADFSSIWFWQLLAEPWRPLSVDTNRKYVVIEIVLDPCP